MHAIGVHQDVVVATSRIWQTTCTAVRSGVEAFVIDSPVLPDELELLPAMLERASFPVVGLLCTHADWDHVLGRLAFPDAALGCAETTAARLRAEPGAAQRSLRDFDEANYVERPRPLSLGHVEALPVPGRLELGDGELELLPADGHTHDGMALWAAWAGVLVCGDYLLPVEIPWLQEQGSRSAYLATLERLRPYLERADWVVPGHGAPLDRERALEIMAQDVAYLRALPDPDAPLPPGRRTPRQREIHNHNIDKVRRAP